jgi:hypothetical protein
MARTGVSGHSASGRSALMAIEWCEANARGWVTAVATSSRPPTTGTP